MLCVLERNKFYISGKINSVTRNERRNCKLKFSFISKRGVMNGDQCGYTDYTVYQQFVLLISVVTSCVFI